MENNTSYVDTVTVQCQGLRKKHKKNMQDYSKNKSIKRNLKYPETAKVSNFPLFHCKSMGSVNCHREKKYMSNDNRITSDVTANVYVCEVSLSFHSRFPRRGVSNIFLKFILNDTLATNQIQPFSQNPFQTGKTTQ